MSSDDVEISTRLRPGEWTEESLATLVQEYQHKIAEMGATPAEIKTHIEHTEAGGVKVRVEWERVSEE
ncbi:hypothetical protein [Arthrobacter sp. GMC3]|uniref:hypothetical protein n=1 Tax=Arthrobacter sp. GMC3 TaxID=2058894 RepID=UPI000CE52747|nr:hypothetical protein [Arthrobacter sp. GMC3]